MTQCPHCQEQLPEVNPGELVIVTPGGSFAFAPGHPMRGAPCLVCHGLIADRSVTVLGVAALDGEACTGSCISLDGFLVHTHCHPDDLNGQTALIYHGLECTRRHQWS